MGAVVLEKKRLVCYVAFRLERPGCRKRAMSCWLIKSHFTVAPLPIRSFNICSSIFSAPCYIVTDGAYMGNYFQFGFWENNPSAYVAAALRCHGLIFQEKQISFSRGRVSSAPCIVNNRRSRLIGKRLCLDCHALHEVFFD